MPLIFGRVKIISETIPWNIEGFAISKDRKRAAFTANEGGFSVLYLMDARSFKFKKVEMKSKGLIGGIKFSDDGKKLGLSLNNAKSPSETHIVNLGKRILDYLPQTLKRIGEISNYIKKKNIKLIIATRSVHDEYIVLLVYDKICKIKNLT